MDAAAGPARWAIWSVRSRSRGSWVLISGRVAAAAAAAGRMARRQSRAPSSSTRTHISSAAAVWIGAAGRPVSRDSAAAAGSTRAASVRASWALAALASAVRSSAAWRACCRASSAASARADAAAAVARGVAQRPGVWASQRASTAPEAAARLRALASAAAASAGDCEGRAASCSRRACCCWLGCTAAARWSPARWAAAPRKLAWPYRATAMHAIHTPRPAVLRVMAGRTWAPAVTAMAAATISAWSAPVAPRSRAPTADMPSPIELTTSAAAVAVG